MEWDKITLDKLGSVSRGRSKHRPRNDESLFNGIYPFIQTGDVKRSGLHIVDYTETYNEKGLAQSKLWAPGTLCITIAANIADTSILSFPACFPDSIIGFVADKEKSDVRFIKYSFDILQKKCQAISLGATQDNLSWEKLSKIKFDIPSLSIQHFIASILSAYDNLIENNNKRIRLLEQMAENLYKEWFVRFRFPGHEKSEFVASKLGKIPSSFSVTNMGDVFEDYIGGGWGNDEESEEFPISASVIRGADFPGVWHYDVSTCPKRFHKKSNYKSRQLQDGDIVMEISGGTSEQPVGRTVLVTQDLIERFEEGRVICASFCKMIRLNKKKISPYFFYFWMHYLYNTRIIDRFQLQSTGIINFKFEPFLKKGIVMLPSRDVMQSFDKFIIPIFKEINQLAIQNENLARQRDLLLPRLMSGKLEVNI